MKHSSHLHAVADVAGAQETVDASEAAFVAAQEAIDSAIAAHALAREDLAKGDELAAAEQTLTDKEQELAEMCSVEPPPPPPTSGWTQTVGQTWVRITWQAVSGCWPTWDSMHAS